MRLARLARPRAHPAPQQWGGGGKWHPPHARARRGPLDFYWALPPLTRTLLTTFVATCLGAWAGVLPAMHMYLAWGKLWALPPQVQLQRRRGWVGGMGAGWGGRRGHCRRRTAG